MVEKRAGLETQILDVKSLRCPMPILKAHKKMASMVAGSILEVWATDIDAPRDMRLYCDNSGHEWLSVESHQEDKETVFVIRVRKRQT